MSKKLRILIVEDNPEHRNRLVEGIMRDSELSDYNPYIVEVESLHKLKAKWDKEFNIALPDIAILDHRLPGLPGEDGTRVALWLLGKKPSLKIIIHSAWPFDPVDGQGEAFRFYGSLPGHVIFLVKEAKTSTTNGEMNIIPVWSEVRPVLLKTIRTLQSEISETLQNLCSKLCAFSPSFIECLKTVESVMTSDIEVLITGETGTGKNVVAREIHNGSLRKNGPYVAINCAEVPEGLFEGLFFGGVKGPFPNAVGNHAGYFEQASKGTIFLDEVTEIPTRLQTKFLEVLEDKKIQRIGADKKIPLDIRVLSASNRVIATAVKDGVFREDLYYRLVGESVHIPPLRERREDIVPLAELFVRNASEKNDSKYEDHYFSSPARKVLTEYSWPGNVRELRNTIKSTLRKVGTERHQIAPIDIKFNSPKNPEIKVHHKAYERMDTLTHEDEVSRAMETVGEKAWFSVLDREQLMHICKQIWATQGEVIGNKAEDIPDQLTIRIEQADLYIRAVLAIFWEAHRTNKQGRDSFKKIFGFTESNGLKNFLQRKSPKTKENPCFPAKPGEQHFNIGALKDDGTILKRNGMVLP